MNNQAFSCLVLGNPPAIPADLETHSWLASTPLNRCLFAQQNHLQSHALLFWEEQIMTVLFVSPSFVLDKDMILP